MAKTEDGKHICQYNNGCACETQNCHKCGWNPEVAERRLKDIKEGLKMGEKKYRIAFTGYCEVWAESEEKALDKADNDEMFFIHYEFADPVCESKERDDELD